jgi:hypothetical protein
VRWRPVVALALLATACRTITPAVPLPEGDPRPAALVAAWQAIAAGRHSLFARAKLSVDGPARVRVQQVLAVERPDRLRVEIQGFLDQTVAVIVTDGAHYGRFRADTRSFEAGPVDPDLLWRETRVALTPEQAVELLLGVPPTQPAAHPGRSFDLGEGRIRVELVDGDGVVWRSLEFDAQARLHGVEVRDAAGGLAWRARFEGYRTVAGQPFAHEITLDVTEGKTHAEILLRDVDLNPSFAPDTFRLRQPREGGLRQGDGG